MGTRRHDALHTGVYEFPNDINQNEAIANVRLIAAAPEMYELLQEFADMAHKVEAFATRNRVKDLLNRIDNG
jgi:hypothetical protein